MTSVLKVSGTQNVDTLEESFMNFKIYHFYKLLNETLIFGNETST